MKTATSKLPWRPVGGPSSASFLPLATTKNQRGAALVMSLMILLILTMLGVAAMGTSSLQEKMSAGVQESTRVFQIAESGLQMSLGTAGTFDLYSPSTTPFSYNGGTVTVTTSYIDISPPKRGSGYSSVDYDGANFDQQSDATGARGSHATVHRGMVQIVGKSK